jgi:hypothetical protein
MQLVSDIARANSTQWLVLQQHFESDGLVVLEPRFSM